MNFPPSLTLTGIDHATDLAAIGALLDTGVEFAVLLTDDRQNRNRYPDLNFIARALEYLGPRLAVHICGRSTRQKAWSGEYDHILREAGRIQINGIVCPEELTYFLARFDRHTIITQHYGANLPLLVWYGANRHSLLVDASGGRGIKPEAWQAPNTAKPVGFAGGLGPSNMLIELRRIAKVASGGWWIDMESSLRDINDWFDIDRARNAIAAWRLACGMDLAGHV